MATRIKLIVLFMLFCITGNTEIKFGQDTGVAPLRPEIRRSTGGVLSATVATLNASGTALRLIAQEFIITASAGVAVIGSEDYRPTLTEKAWYIWNVNVAGSDKFVHYVLANGKVWAASEIEAPTFTAHDSSPLVLESPSGQKINFNIHGTNHMALNTSGQLEFTATTEKVYDNSGFIVLDGGSGGLLKDSGANVAVWAASIFRPNGNETITLGNTANRWDTFYGTTIDVTGTATLAGTNILSGLTYPTSDGTSGQAIVTDGVGGLSIANPSITMSRISGSTYFTVQDIQNLMHSAGVIEWSGVVDDGDGTITVALGNGLIRAVNSATAEMFFFDWAAEAGANVALVDSTTQINYIYVEYNGGSPQVIATTTQRTDFHTNVLLATIARIGTTLHINTIIQHLVGDHANNMIRRLKDTQPFGRTSGGIITEVGTRNIAITAGEFWEGLVEFSTNAFDSSAADRFSYFYRAAGGGFTKATGVAQIDNLQYDDGTGTLATLSNNRFGVHWVYMEVDSDVSVLYGQGDFTLSQAEDSQPPSSLPSQIAAHGFLVGKIIIVKSAAAFTQIESAFETTFSGSLATDHGDLTSLLAPNDHHTQYSLVDGSRAFTGNITVSNSAPQITLADITASASDGEFLVDDNKLYIQEDDDTNGDAITLDLINKTLGINQSSPANQIHIKANNDNSSSGIRIEDLDTTNITHLIWQASNTGNLQLRDINVAKISLLAAGSSVFEVDVTFNDDHILPDDTEATGATSGNIRVDDANQEVDVYFTTGGAFRRITTSASPRIEVNRGINDASGFPTFAGLGPVFQGQNGFSENGWDTVTFPADATQFYIISAYNEEAYFDAVGAFTARYFLNGSFVGVESSTPAYTDFTLLSIALIRDSTGQIIGRDITSGLLPIGAANKLRTEDDTFAILKGLQRVLIDIPSFPATKNGGSLVSVEWKVKGFYLKRPLSEWVQ